MDEVRKPNKEFSVVAFWSPVISRWSPNTGEWRQNQRYEPSNEIAFQGTILSLNGDIYTVPWIVEVWTETPVNGNSAWNKDGAGSAMLYVPMGPIAMILTDCCKPSFQYEGSGSCVISVENGLVYTNMQVIWTK